MNVAIHQPDYLPYLGYFYKMAQADVFVFLDDAQFSNDNMHNWNRVKMSNGVTNLKVPVIQHLGDPINAVKTRDELDWKQKHLRTLQMAYSRAAFYKPLMAMLQPLILAEHDSIGRMNIEINACLAWALGIRTKFVLASELGIATRKEQRVLDICKALGATRYISGNGARAYQNPDNFHKAGIELVYTDYKPVPYKQLWGEFEPNMSVIDYMFNNGFSCPQLTAALSRREAEST